MFKPENMPRFLVLFIYMKTRQNEPNNVEENFVIKFTFKSQGQIRPISGT